MCFVILNMNCVGVLPLGRTNTIGKILFPGGDYLEEVRSMADATLAVVEEMVKPVDVMRIEIVDDESKSESNNDYTSFNVEFWSVFFFFLGNL